MNHEDNLLLLTDSYKVTHGDQYPPDVRHVYSYFESRGCAPSDCTPGGQDNFTDCVFFGLSYFLQRYLEGQAVTLEKIEEAQEFAAAHFGNTNVFHRERWMHILEKHGGRLPVVIKSVPEGTVVPLRNVLMTVENTDPECAWLVSHLETMLVQIWYSTTTATISRFMKRILLNSLIKSGDPSLLPFKLHDFGARGVSSPESAMLGGAGHLVNFMGTDTMYAARMLRNYYGAPMAGFSIPASEHSTMTSWGRENEVDAYRNMLQKFPSGLVAVVSDSWDIYAACRDIWGAELKEQVIFRDGVLVIRPDSGDPTIVLPKLLNILGVQFGSSTNSKGYKLLHPKVRLIQGDGITRFSLAKIVEAVMAAGWSMDNLAFGSGGGLLQSCDRDTLKFAFKCSSIRRADGTEMDVFKKPVTAGWKSSKAGRLKLVNVPGLAIGGSSPLVTVKEDAAGFASYHDLLQETFRDGQILVRPTLDEIRERAAL